MITITRTSDSETSSPIDIRSYEAELEGTNILHRLADGGIAMTLMAHLPRSGTVSLYYPDRASAFASVALHTSTKDTFTLADSESPELDMVYTAGNVSPAIEDQTRSWWVVDVRYQEVL